MEFLASSSITSDVFVAENNANHNLVRFLPASALEQGYTLKFWTNTKSNQKQNMSVARNQTRAGREKVVQPLLCVTRILQLCDSAIRRFYTAPRDSRDSAVFGA